MANLLGSTSLTGPDDRIPLTQVARELVAGGFTVEPVEYIRVYRGVLSGAIPAEQTVSGRWNIRRADLSAVATTLRLTPAPKVGKPARAPRAASASVAA